MKKITLLLLALIIAAQVPALARTQYDRWGHKIEPTKKTHSVSAAAKMQTVTVQNLQTSTGVAPQTVQLKVEEKVKEKIISDGVGRDMGKAVRNGDGDDFTMYDARGRKTGSYVEDKNGKGSYYDLRGREIRVRRTTQDIK